MLRGGLGKKARAAVADAIAARDLDATGIVLVATGSYLGEGFDWPELDTLFLAFPLAFKGRVVQYVGRLLRTHAGKHHVELHDYVDVRIPVLDRDAHQAAARLRHPRLRHPQDPPAHSEMTVAIRPERSVSGSPCRLAQHLGRRTRLLIYSNLATR